VHLRAWLARFAGRDDVAFAVEECTGWRYVAEELAAARIAAHVGEPADTAAARGRKRHAKTGKTDAAHLRTLLAEDRLPECWLPPAQILEYRALLETYHDLRTEHTAWRGRGDLQLSSPSRVAYNAAVKPRLGAGKYPLNKGGGAMSGAGARGPVEGARGAAGQLIIALGSAGVSGAAVNCSRSWLDVTRTGVSDPPSRPSSLVG
jgi:hypothetical protein